MSAPTTACGPPPGTPTSFQPGFEDADTSVTAAIGLNGWYGGYYGQQLAFLLLFAVAALLIGLLVRRPFMGLNHFMEEKLEETELL